MNKPTGGFPPIILCKKDKNDIKKGVVKKDKNKSGARLSIKDILGNKNI